MKTVKFYIKRLGAIKDSSIELAPLMVFSGESGLGKSYVAFLVHYLYVLLTGVRLERFFFEKGYNLKNLLKDKKPDELILNVSVSELVSWINKDAITYIGYLLGHNNFVGEVEIELPFKEDSLVFAYDEEIVGLDNNEEVFYKIMLEGFVYRMQTDTVTNDPTPFVALIRAILLNEIFGDYTYLRKTYLMPPSRGALIELNERPAFSSGMYEEFFDFKMDLNRPLKETQKIDEALVQYLSEVNVGDVQQVEGRLMYYTNNVEMPVTAAASSIKELAPLTLLLKKFPVNGMSVLFEEPEAHLHPGRQVKVADLIGCAIHRDCHMQITTHSDYFIKRLNNLIMLYQIKNRNYELYETISNKWNIQETCLIDPQKVGAYLLVRDQDGSSRIVKQEITDEGIPFESFYQVIENDISMSRELRKALNS
ncbi:AAA family ATPase [Bacteroides ovatus]|uniref:AAA family ATPase n=1 Tax=Bacteroides ovatus TaxID=28116 RepID=UPI000E1D1D1C|nr:AAA family ATPase [Bacteroides ovatus]RDT80681.1 hypothetical protein DXF98_13815 [Bacteroides ovatus]